MSSNRHKNLMCNVCGKVMRDDHLKRHMNSKHSNVSSSLHHSEKHPQYMKVMVDVNIKHMMKMNHKKNIVKMKRRVIYRLAVVQN